MMQMVNISVELRTKQEVSTYLTLKIRLINSNNVILYCKVKKVKWCIGMFDQ